jgi:hypothetical protein
LTPTLFVDDVDPRRHVPITGSWILRAAEPKSSHAGASSYLGDPSGSYTAAKSV